MKNGKIKVLAVDDEEINLEILEDDLQLAGYEVLCAENGKKAWQVLEENPDIMVILLDRMMPEMDGMEFISELKANDRYKDIPVIMQTGAALTEQVKEGIEAGVYYYLTKPYDEALLLAIVDAAVSDIKRTNSTYSELLQLQTKLDDLNTGLGKLVKGQFEFSTPEEVKNIAFILASSCPDPKKAVLGITEIMQNAIEHGNLGITFEEKSKLLLGGTYHDEIKQRLELPENRNKKATVEIKRTSESLVLIITDDGEGFEWERFINFSPERATLPNGRGIAMAGLLSFDKIEFVEPGNRVICSIDTGLS